MDQKRDTVLDTFRGLIIILMALDHSATFIAKHSVGNEVWGLPLPIHSDGISFFIRWISHLCAPGFSFLVGVSLVFLFRSRDQKGWSRSKIQKFVMIRGAVIILLQHLIYNGAWFIFLKTSNMETSPFPGNGGMPLLAFSILSALGFSMIFWSFLMNVKTSNVVIISVLGILITQIIVPGSENVDTLYSPVLRLLFIPGQTGIWLVRCPFIPWLSFTGFGIVWGRILIEEREKAWRFLRYGAIAALIGFVVIRMFNGFGNTHSWSESFISFMHVTKFPPSIAYTLVTMGVNFLILSLLYKFKYKLRRVAFLEIFGKAPLFFYFSHIYLYLLIGFFFPDGINLIDFFPLWMAGLLILYFPCWKYGIFKGSLHANSFWKIF